MVYDKINFPKLSNRPYFYSNFVSTVDGKIKVVKGDSSKYWPIGSKVDFETLIDLRAMSDVLINGKLTAFGHPFNMINKPEFNSKRKSFGKNKPLDFVILSAHPDQELLETFKQNVGPITTKIYLITTDSAGELKEFEGYAEVVRLGEERVDINKLSQFLFDKGLVDALVEGGPHLMGSFFEADLIDEVFLTLAPKIYGNQDNSTITMVEGYLLPPDKIKQLELVSVKEVANELFLRYKVIR